MKGKGGFESGHETINAAARLKTELGPSGCGRTNQHKCQQHPPYQLTVPFGLAAATSLIADRCREVCSDSVTRIEAATVRISVLEIKDAPPK